MYVPYAFSFYFLLQLAFDFTLIYNLFFRS